jgi:hypothetical protein
MSIPFRPGLCNRCSSSQLNLGLGTAIAKSVQPKDKKKKKTARETVVRIFA